MTFSFFKMQGAGNDFIIFDDRNSRFPIDNKNLIREITDRKKGIGSDGLILLQNSKYADIRMRFFNPDGTEVNMCGNGSRCISRLAILLKITNNNLTLETNIGIIDAVVNGDMVKLFLDLDLDSSVQLNLKVDKDCLLDVYNSGVPHAVIWDDNIENINLMDMGCNIRWHDFFSPDGINVNIVQVLDENKLKIRTYERGVESETQACGTGAIAASVLAVKREVCNFPVSVLCSSGDILIVDYKKQKTTLEGKAILDFKGEWSSGNRV